MTNKDISFTFGIITDNSELSVNEYLPKIIKSIEHLNIPKYEILIVGEGAKIKHLQKNNVNYINFDESAKPKWITKKKNIITQNARYRNIVYQHDYIIYDKDWYKHWKEFGDNFSLCMNAVIMEDGRRYRDWSIFPRGNLFDKAVKYCNVKEQDKRKLLIPYSETGFSALQYFSGAYWVAKKHVMNQFPLDEKLTWGKGEDVEWSFKVREKYNFSINSKSKVYLLKHNSRAFSEMPEYMHRKFKEFLQKQGKYRR